MIHYDLWFLHDICIYACHQRKSKATGELVGRIPSRKVLADGLMVDISIVGGVKLSQFTYLQTSFGRKIQGKTWKIVVQLNCFLLLFFQLVIQLGVIVLSGFFHMYVLKGRATGFESLCCLLQ